MTSNLTTHGKSVAACESLGTLEQRLACLADAGLPAIQDRIVRLDREWTAGRMTKCAIGILIIAGFALTAVFGPWWLILPAVGGAFLLQYLFSRTSWLGKAFHELGYRTSLELDQEKTALKILRGDFRDLPTVHDVENREDISRLEGEGGIAMEPEVAKVDPIDAAKSVVEATKS